MLLNATRALQVLYDVSENKKPDHLDRTHLNQ